MGAGSARNLDVAKVRVVGSLTGAVMVIVVEKIKRSRRSDGVDGPA